MGEVHAHYTDMVLEERGVAFRQTQADQAYNPRLLDEHRRIENLLAIGPGIAADMEVDEQEALL